MLIKYCHAISTFSHRFQLLVVDGKRGLLKRATRPPGSESPLQFDAYTLNHAAFVGLQVCRNR